MTDCDRILKQFSELLIKSEDRMNTVSKTVSDCVIMVNKITNEYTTQLDKLQKIRDEIVLQNKILIENSQRDKDMYDKLNDKYSKVVDTLVDANRQYRTASENNITIH